MARKVMTIDPGLGGTGWCYWKNLHPKAPAPSDHGVLSAYSKAGWQARASWIVEEFADLLKSLRVRKDCAVVIEWPALWVGSARSIAAAGREDLTKLVYLIGQLGRESAKQTGNEVILLPVQTWKGQLSKKEVLRRLKERTGISFKNHEGDAGGMGLHLLGLLNKD
jgi:hypothetical protein